jgi:hypothetical protein
MHRQDTAQDKGDCEESRQDAEAVPRLQTLALLVLDVRQLALDQNAAEASTGRGVLTLMADIRWVCTDCHEPIAPSGTYEDRHGDERHKGCAGEIGELDVSLDSVHALESEWLANVIAGFDSVKAALLFADMADIAKVLIMGQPSKPAADQSEIDTELYSEPGT